jgi:uncharacterized membrane protein HdeD (DUF308 family)
MKHWFILLLAGLVAILGGLFALFNPIGATFAATRIVAFIFIFMGALQIVAIVIGVWIIGNPIEGTMVLTWTIGLLFLVEGIVKIVLAFAARGTGYFWMLLLTGAVSVLLAGMILSRYPASALTIPGILLAVDLISTGVAMAALALHFRSRRIA